MLLLERLTVLVVAMVLVTKSHPGGFSFKERISHQQMSAPYQTVYMEGPPWNWAMSEGRFLFSPA